MGAVSRSTESSRAAYLLSMGSSPDTSEKDAANSSVIVTEIVQYCKLIGAWSCIYSERFFVSTSGRWRVRPHVTCSLRATVSADAIVGPGWCVALSRSIAHETFNLRLANARTACRHVEGVQASVVVSARTMKIPTEPNQNHAAPVSYWSCQPACRRFRTQIPLSWD